MKKFLSLVLALIMTMSLVTISASAAEYKDFTDKDEIQYEEAVAVLNRLGIITGYAEGDFRPEGELTRGAAAKIIVSLLIGPEAANNVSPTTAPYSDVPLDHTFAGPIAFCKTEKIINGYKDGSFHPGDTLTGYAFSKMLLGALGYKGDIEGYTGAGWNMNVNKDAADAGLFDRLNFKGNDPVNREEAAQLALNTLKATVVTYSGSMTVTAGDASVVTDPVRSYKTSNQDFARNISADTAANNAEYYTVEFGEEHFIDLKLEHDKHNPAEDDFGRPSNEWSYKKVTIGTFPIAADFTFTEQVAHLKDKDAAKERALGLGKYEVTASRGTNNGWGTAAGWGQTHVYVNGQEVDDLDKVATIADYTDNGATVEVYIDNDDADFISHVVVTQPMLVEVKKVGGDYVSLDLIEADAKGAGFNQKPLDNYDVGDSKNVEYRGMKAIEKLQDVEVDDNGYDVLKDLKAGDKVVVIPVAVNHIGDTWEVARAYVPETASGKLTRVETYDQDANNITVGGTAYKVSQWNKDIKDIDADIIKVTVKDVTLYLDENGCALLADEVGETSDYMVIGGWSQGLVNNKIVNIVDGWDVSGNALSLNVGTTVYKDNSTGAYQPGDLVKYTNEGTTGVADWKLMDGSNESATNLTSWQNSKGTDGYYEDLTKIYEVDAYNDGTDTAGSASYVIKSSNTRIALKAPAYEDVRPVGSSAVVPSKSGANILVKAGVAKDAAYSTSTNLAKSSTFYFANDVKFIYVDFETNSNAGRAEVERIEVLKGAQNVTTTELLARSAKAAHSASTVYHSAQAYVDKNGEVKAVVIKTQSNNAMSNNLLFVREHWGEHIVEEATGGKKVYGYTVAMMNTDGTLTDEKNIYCDKNLTVGTFATYAESTLEGFDNYYTVKEYDSLLKTTSVMRANVLALGNPQGTEVVNKWLLRVDDGTVNASSTTAFTIGGTPLVNPDDGTAAPAGDRTPGAAWIMSNNRGTSDTIDDNFDAKGLLRFTSRTKWVDMSDGNNYIDSLEDLEDFVNVDIRMIVNDNKESDSFREVVLAIVYSAVGGKDRAEAPAGLDINVSPAKPAGGYAVGTELTLTATLTNSSSSGMKNVTYVWFNDTDGDGVLDVGETTLQSGSSNTFKMTAGQYGKVSVIVTNTDSSKTISTSSASTTVIGDAGTDEIGVDSSTAKFTVTVNLDGIVGELNGNPVTGTFTVEAGPTSPVQIKNLALIDNTTSELPEGVTNSDTTKAQGNLSGTTLTIIGKAAGGTVSYNAVEIADITVNLNGQAKTVKSNQTVNDIPTIDKTGYIVKAVTTTDAGGISTTTYSVAPTSERVVSGAAYFDKLTALTLADDVTTAAPIAGAASATTLGSYTYATAAKAGTTENTNFYVIDDIMYVKSGAVFTATITCETAGTTQDKTDTVTVNVSNNSGNTFTVGSPVTWATETSGGTPAATGSKTVDISMGSTPDKLEHVVTITGANA